MLDASYRNCFTQNNVFPSRPSGFPKIIKNDNEIQFSGLGITNTGANSTAPTDTQLWNNFPNQTDSNTSKQNTDLFINGGVSSPSTGPGWCRSKKVSHNNKIYGCDLPNLQTLIVIEASMYRLDYLDPTPNGHTFLFTKARSGNNYNWSPLKSCSNLHMTGWVCSSEALASDRFIWNAVDMLVNVAVDILNSSIQPQGIVPVLELELIE